ncbi:CRM-domain containing factor CFM2, chloroplastic isoform X1 [Phoenix dactylifera]|uniref:CRM-domain containing factor CFM3, chloroplastic/mitochondrial n=1 Tax=Phoenix dactylifera TaxID=42345 RepID=A0A8B8J641_PHODC|nr:CRM-domain containing factor CFM2, chloroplastic isoform X1 [Phoenix dactylifera]XP_008793803.1 CRM-domain containing factor CFM2, chloroplastic isoform X1 [Phoenix dactylifera]XP_008793804.1 CRM-domain containing factor CFM2, chloroplastic isoform X1 [Phoenix dactylifera]XP_026661581.1 CRM-domain containing factor CFM2, chloroplastic isoform X1 [Phoenix dactylifera]XP_026661582.1 CRM-domain containing factor CFM2, chloroplastic isoform X1 [Phoenix dactylifera]
MYLFLSHPSPFLSPKTPADSPSPPFLPPASPRLSLRFQNPKPPKSYLRASSASAPANETLAKSAIQRISEKLRSLGYLADEPTKSADRPPTGPGSAGEIFIPTPHEIPKRRVGHTIDSSWSTPEHPVPEPGSGGTITRFNYLWSREKEQEKEKKASKEVVPTVAELTIPAEVLKRLRSEGIRLQKRLKVGKAGITEGIVNGIHERWRRSELVKIKCEDLCRMNMKRTHEILERKTGGLVVWRSGSIIILYRGANYKYPYFHYGDQMRKNVDEVSPESSMEDGALDKQGVNSMPACIVKSSSGSFATSAQSFLVIGVGSPNKVRLQQPGEAQLEEEADRLLDGLGPRFTNWWGYDPLPVDADLLPAIVPGFRKPFRLLPFGIKPKLTDREMTILRRLSRHLPCHFALGRNRNHQGLAVSMIKLWEKCEVAKIAIKRGVQNTNSELMAEELKQLTGGTLLSKDKEYIVFYRGKDFLPPAVSLAIEERRNGGIGIKRQNTDGRGRVATIDAPELEFVRAASADEPHGKAEEKRALSTERRPRTALERVETKLFQVMEEKEKAEKLLKELEKPVEPLKVESDKEGISEEERYMLRKVGLRMQPFLLLGRRGVFAGTVENMHLHWKYRELIKIISKDRCIENVERAARILEAESGGILVAVERVSKGHAIIVYRGKNYKRPSNLRPQTLLSKREAMKRSLEAQRSKSLKLRVLNLSRNIDRLKHQMSQVKDGSLEDSVQLTEHERISSAAETNDQSGSTLEDRNGSADFTFQQESAEEVHEIHSESMHSKDHGHNSRENGEIVNEPSNVVGSAFPLNSLEHKLMISKHEHENSETEVVRSLSDTRNDTNILNNESGCTSVGPAFHLGICPQEAQASCSTTNNIVHNPSKGLDSSLVATRREPDSMVHGDILEQESAVEIPFKASPLSNRERLILRKQALKMRNRPVLAVGRNNAISGVAKTIKTHFKKHPLAIVNIKHRAKGTPVQELIFELEQATGAVLVSREPNKVILYRGWGERETPGGVKEVKPSKGDSKGTVPSQLMAAIRLECGLQTNDLK